jgi:membrane-associated phospholipid phosphatase
MAMVRLSTRLDGSRIYGGIHPSVDDFGGRWIGSICGQDAWALAQRYFDGSARS